MKKITDYLGADVAIDAVGAEADGNLIQHVTSAKLKLQGGSPVALNWAIDSRPQGRHGLGDGRLRADVQRRQVRRRDEQGPDAAR